MVTTLRLALRGLACLLVVGCGLERQIAGQSGSTPGREGEQAIQERRSYAGIDGFWQYSATNSLGVSSVSCAKVTGDRIQYCYFTSRSTLEVRKGALEEVGGNSRLVRWEDDRCPGPGFLAIRHPGGSDRPYGVDLMTNCTFDPGSYLQPTSEQCYSVSQACNFD